LVLKVAEALVERFQGRAWCVELYRLRGVFLTATGGNETKIEVSFHNAIRTARERKSISLATRAEATYAEFAGEKRAGQEDEDSDYRIVDAQREKLVWPRDYPT
jgi:hypothetical protein